MSVYLPLDAHVHPCAMFAWGLSTVRVHLRTRAAALFCATLQVASSACRPPPDTPRGAVVGIILDVGATSLLTVEATEATQSASGELGTGATVHEHGKEHGKEHRQAGLGPPWMLSDEDALKDWSAACAHTRLHAEMRRGARTRTHWGACAGTWGIVIVV